MQNHTVVIEVSVVYELQGEAAPTAHDVQLSFSSGQGNAAAAIKAEALRLVGDGARNDFKFVQRLFEALPELRKA